MAGMMSEAMPQQQSPGPMAETPPTGAPPGAPTSGSPAGPGQQPQVNREGQSTPEEVKRLTDEAVKLVYGDRFDQLIKMFETNGADNFPRSMAVAVNTALTELEKNNPMPFETVAKVGMEIYMRLIEDMIKGGVVPDVKLEQVQEALPAILVTYADSHPDVSKEDVQGVMQAASAEAQAQGGDKVDNTSPETPDKVDNTEEA